MAGSAAASRHRTSACSSPAGLTPTGSSTTSTPPDAEQDFATYRREIERACQAAAGRELDETFFHSHRNAQISVRWVYARMIEEYARHNGHADLLRERIDGTTGL